MKPHKTFLMALAVALAPLAGWCAADDAANPSQPPAAAMDMAPKLSRPAKDVVKMVTSGVPDEVVKAYIQNNPATYDLTPDNIIHMQGVGVSGSVTGEILSHDKKVREQSAMAQTSPLPPGAAPASAPYPAAETQPVSQPANTVSVYTIPSDNSPYYSDLAPYGSWYYGTDYGWCWQPRIGLGYGYYPWGILRSGRWWNCAGRGWVWSPGAGFRGTGGVFGGSRGFAGTRGFVSSRGFAGTRGFVSGQNHFRSSGGTFVSNRSPGNFHSSVSVHTINSGSSHGGSSHWGGGGISRSGGGGHSFGGGRSGGGHR